MEKIDISLFWVWGSAYNACNAFRVRQKIIHALSMISDPWRVHLEFGIYLLEIRINISPVLNIVPEILMAWRNFQQGVKDAQALAYLLAEVLEFLYIGKRNVIVNNHFDANPRK